MNGKEVIIFDLDGVIVDSVGLMAELNRNSFPGITDQQIKDLHKENIHEAIKKTTLVRKEESEEEFQTRMLEYTNKKLLAPIYEGVEKLLSTLAKEYILVLSTSAIQRNSLPILERNGIDKYFSFIGSAEVHKSKVEKFKLIAEKFNQDISRLLFITDTIGDINEAAEVGVPTIAVTWGLHNKADFSEVVSDHFLGCADNPAELLSMIDCYKKA